MAGAGTGVTFGCGSTGVGTGAGTGAVLGAITGIYVGLATCAGGKLDSFFDPSVAI